MKEEIDFAKVKAEIKLLVEQARQGSEKAFNELYYTYRETIWWTAFKIVKNIDVADDIVSMVFTKAFTKLDTYTQHISFEMWLKTITLNTAIDYVRKNKKEQLNNYIDDEETSNIQLDEKDYSPEDKYIYKQEVDITMKCISLLKKKYRDMLNMRLEGKTYQQIAMELAIPEATVRTDLNKARRRLKQLIKDNY